MTDPVRCSPECVIPADMSRSSRLSMSDRPDPSWIVDGVVLRRIAEGGHDRGHPFWFPGSGATIDERASLLKRIREDRPLNVVPIIGECDCSYTSPVLAGQPLQDFGLAANGNSLIHPHQRRIAWPPNVLERHLSELANGLYELHSLGIAHGDPALMNAFVAEAEESPQAHWVDLNSIQRATTAATATDIAAFELTCLWPALIDADLHSPSLFADLTEIARDADEPLKAYHAALATRRHDHRSGNPRAELLESVARTDPGLRTDSLGEARRRLLGLMSPTYFLDQTKSDLNARFFASTLAAERTRHTIVEEERTRLHRIRYQSEIETLQETVAALRDEVEKSAVRLSRRSTDVEAAREALEVVRSDLTDTLDRSRQLEDVIARLNGDLNQIYNSRAWRLVSILRSVKNRLLSPLRRQVQGSSSNQQPGDSAKATDSITTYPCLVSVIMPVFNKGATLRETVDSVLAQTLESVEILVWNDGSTDQRTLSVLEEISSLPRVQVFHADNRGVVAARNSAMSLARGRYFCCVDPDDIIDRTYLEKACAVLQSGAGHAIAYPYVHSFGDVDENWETQDLDPALILEANHVPICAVFDRRVFDLTGGFSEEMADGYEDWEFWVHAAELGFTGKAIPEHLFHYRYSRSHQESRDALARQRGSALKGRIGALHPHLARTGRPVDSVLMPDMSSGELTLGNRAYPAGSGNPIIVTLPWFTIGGADTVVEMAVRRWVGAGRTVVIITTHEVGPGMTNRIEDLRTIAPYVYQLPAMLPEHLWDDFVEGVVSSLDSPSLWNVGSAWLYRHLPELRAKFPALTVVDQQFNEIGHMDSNRRAAEFIDVTVAAYAQLAEKLGSDGRTTKVKPIYVGIDAVEQPPASAANHFRKALGVKEDQDLVLYVGRLSEEKRPEWMVELANRLEPAEAKVALIGNGPLRDVISKAADDNQELIWIEKAESVLEAISAADVIALPSRTEGIPLVALEALAMGTPLVAASVGGLPDLKGINGVTLTDPTDFEDFVRGIRAALQGPWPDVALPAEFRSESMLEELDQVLFGHSRD